MRNYPQILATIGAALTVTLQSLAAADLVFTLPQPTSGPSYHSVWLGGTFNDWQPDSIPMALNGVDWKATVSLTDGEYEYKFRVVDVEGNDYWLNDFSNPCYAPNQFGGVNNYLQIENGVKKTATDGLEYFEYFAPEARFVNLAGDFNDWKQGGVDLLKRPDGMWQCWIKIDRPITYQFIVDDLWKVDPNPAILQVPSNYDTFNSFRPVVEGESEGIDWLSLANDEAFERTTLQKSKQKKHTDLLNEAKDASRKGRYAEAVALIRISPKVAKAAEKAHAECVALEEEAELHKKFGHPARSAKVWEKIRNTFPDTPAERHATHELAKHFLYQESDKGQARELFGEVLRKSKNSEEEVSALFDLSMCYWKEGDHTNQLALLNQALDVSKKVKRTDNEWLHLHSEILIYKGVAEFRVENHEGAYEYFHQALAVSPWPNSQVSQFAQIWIKHLETVHPLEIEGVRK